MKDQTRHEPEIAKEAEKRMKAWEMSQEVADRSIREHGAHHPGRQFGRFLADVSEPGSRTGEAARASPPPLEPAPLHRTSRHAFVLAPTSTGSTSPASCIRRTVVEVLPFEHPIRAAS